MITKKEKRERRQGRIRSRVSGTGARPRLAVFKSNRFIYAQLIDDTKGATLASATSQNGKGTMRERAKEVGKAIAKDAATKKITAVVFDRGGFAYTGVVKELADGAREGGLTF